MPQTENPKSAIRNEPEVRKRKKKRRAAFPFADFGFRVCFGFRISDFGFACAFGLLLCLLASDAHAQDPFEPTVTRAESELLQQSVSLSETDLAAAIALLRDQNLKNASPALDYALGNFYTQTNRLADAESAYRAALEKLPRFRAARNNLARVYLMQDRPAPAMEVFAELVRDGQGDAETYTLYGHACTFANNTIAAETAYRQALLLQPASADARRGLAKCLVEQERLAEALALVDELLILEPAAADWWSLRANIQLTQNQPAAALASLETARRLGAATTEMLATLGDLHLNQQQPADAVAAYTAAFALTNAPVARQLRAAEGLLQAGEMDKAADLLDQLDARAKADPNAFDATQSRQRLRLRAEAARLAGQADAARTALEKLLQEDPLDGASLLAIGDLEREAGKLEDAKLAFERAARIQGFEARALVRAAQVEVARERYPAAIALLETAQAFDDQPHVARYLEQVRRLAR